MRSEAEKHLHAPDPGALVRNSVFVAAGQASVALLFIAYVIAARTLGGAAFGQFTLGMTIAALAFTLPAWGTSRYAAITAARDPHQTRGILSTSLGLTALLATLYFPLIWGIARLVSDDQVVVVVTLVLGVDFFIREYGQLLRFLFRVHNAFSYEAVTAVVERGLMVLLAGVGLLVRPGPVMLASCFLLGRTVGVALTSVLFRRRVSRIGFRFSPPELRALLSAGTPLALRRGLSSLSFRIDTVLLGVMRTSSEVGWYGAVYTLMDGVIMFPSVISGVLGPIFSANFGTGRRKIVERLYRRGLRYLLLAGLFLGAVFLFLGDQIVLILYGEEYAEAAIVLKVFSLATLFIFLRRLAQEVMDNIDLRGATVWAFWVAVVTNVVLNLLFIPRYGIAGAAWATAATEGILLTAMVWMLARDGCRPGLFSQSKAPVLAILLPGWLLWTFDSRPVLAALTAGSAYVLGLTIAGAWDEADRELFAGTVARLRHRATRGTRGQ